MSRHRVFHLLLLVAGALILLHCHRGKRAESLRYHDKTGGWSISVPAGWSVDTEVLGAMGVMIHADKEGIDDPVVENVTVLGETVHEGVDVEKYREFTLRVFRNRVPNHEITEEGAGDIDGEKTLWFSYRHEVEGVPLLSRVYLFVKEDRGFGVTWTCSSREEQRFEPVLEEIVRSLRFR